MRLINKNQKGQTIIEVIIALAILGVVAVAFLGGLSTALHGVGIANERSTAQSLAQSQMEHVKSQGYYNATAPEYEAIYESIIAPANYYIRGLHRDGYIATAHNVTMRDNWYDFTNEDIIGVPWDPENGSLPTDKDTDIQIVTVIVYHPSYNFTFPDKNVVLTLTDFKVNR